MPDDNETKQELLDAIRRERATFDEFVAGFDDEAMLRGARDDDWTPKDVVAHVTAWEQRALRWLNRWRETGNPGRPEIGVTWEGMDEINDADYRASREKSPADVRGEAEESYARIVATLEAIDDAELAAKPETADGPSWAWIIGANTYEHYEEHREEMEAWRSR